MGSFFLLLGQIVWVFLYGYVMVFALGFENNYDPLSLSMRTKSNRAY